jgi:hypothetical protein
MVSMLAIRPKVRRFKPGRRQWIFKGNKICSMLSFEGEVKPEAPRQDSMACKKSLASMNKNTSHGQILIPFACSSCLLPDDYAGRIARELW